MGTKAVMTATKRAPGSGAVLPGPIIVSIGAMPGATCAFFIGRYFARDLVMKKIDQYPKFKSINEAVGREGWKPAALRTWGESGPKHRWNGFFMGQVWQPRLLSPCMSHKLPLLL